jgi:pimeloyl-ACP methyl ester carboxylesterase
MNRVMLKKFLLAILIFSTLAIHAQPTHTPDTLVVLGPSLEGLVYPYPVKYITLNEQQQVLKMAYMDVQPARPNGHAILLLHGKNFCGDYWGATASLLAANGYRVIIPDQIGFGKSSKPDHLQYSFQLLARNTKTLLESAGVDNIIVLGHSMGGMIATRFTLMFPDKVERVVPEIRPDAQHSGRMDPGSRI